MSKILGVIPARYSSIRLPGKPLRMIGDKPMIQHTYESANKSVYLDRLVVLTDDQRIYKVVKDFGGQAELTHENLKSGTDRAAYFANENPEFDIIVNIQGDEPFIKREIIDKSIKPLLQIDEVQVSTAATNFQNESDLKNPSMPKVVVDKFGYALYFSRAIIPYAEKILDIKIFLRHIGLYVYRRDALLQINKLAQTQLEKMESLEQLRMIENGYKIKVEVFQDYDSISVDTDQDLIAANEFFKKLGNENSQAN
ncbi:MAG: 3-deoxy-manno-octulosonate cytidylyltransferase [Ignavibacteria bacterium]|nr:3-deoxy-manno-octulosonate cytidylyltransferase [Ignavibacteria bacterium]